MHDDLFLNEGPKVTPIQLKDGELLHQSHFIPPAAADELFKRLTHEIDWQQEEMKIYGKTHLLPRLTCWMGDKDVLYSYSGIRMVAAGWSEPVLQLKTKIEGFSQTTFNSCLLNYYRNGQDSMGWHQDNEVSLGKNPIIASLTFGATRSFQLRHLTDASAKKIRLNLTHGAALLMRGTTQHFWQHQLPKTTKDIGPRINLTFRKIVR